MPKPASLLEAESEDRLQPLHQMTTEVGGTAAGYCRKSDGSPHVWMSWTCHEGVVIRGVLTAALAKGLLRQLEGALDRVAQVERINHARDAKGARR